MVDFLEFQVDKFIFRVAADRQYTDEGLWLIDENGSIKVGISDYLQKRSGDVAFVETPAPGSMIQAGDELAVIETIKVNISLSSPVTGMTKESNPALEATPEVINLDPYGEGWLVKIEPQDGTVWKTLYSPQDYFNRIKLEAEQEAS